MAAGLASQPQNTLGLTAGTNHRRTTVVCINILIPWPMRTRHTLTVLSQTAPKVRQYSKLGSRTAKQETQPNMSLHSCSGTHPCHLHRPHAVMAQHNCLRIRIKFVFNVCCPAAGLT